MIDNPSLRRFRLSAALGLALVAATSATAFAQASSGSIGGNGDDAQSNSGPGTGVMTPGASGTDSGTTGSFRTDSISGNGDDAQSNSTNGSAAGAMTGTAPMATQNCDAAQVAAGATLCNQQSGDDAESASGLPQQSN